MVYQLTHPGATPPILPVFAKSARWPCPSPQPMTAEAQAKLLEAFEARQRGEWDKALDLLRRWRAHIDPSLVSYLRGSIWLEAGDPETAALFYAHAHKLEPTNGNYQAMTLYSLNIADSAAALKEATKILRNHEHSSPAGVARAADIVFMSARLKSEIEANHLFEQIEPILKATLARMRQGDLAQIDRSSYVTLLSLLGFGYEFFGKSQAALEIYSEALQIEPDNDAIHVARGMLLYGTSARAIADFETAIQNGTPLVWPYVISNGWLSPRRSSAFRRTWCEGHSTKLCSAILPMNELNEISQRSRRQPVRFPGRLAP